MYKRIVIKLSGEALLGSSSMYDADIVNNIITDIQNIMAKGVQVSLVIGGGNIWRGRSAPDMDSSKADQIGMLATVMNSIYLADRFIARGTNAVVMTPFQVGAFTEIFKKDTALEYLENNSVVIFGGGVGHPFFSTDTIPALRAAELNCDCVLFAKNVNGIYDKNPDKYKDAIRYKTLTYRKIIQDNLEAIDITGIALCEKNNIPSLVFSLNTPNSIEIAATKDPSEIATIITVNGNITT